MALTLEQLKIIRDSSIDEEAFQRIVSLLDTKVDTNSDSSQESLPSKPSGFHLDPEQLHLLSSLLNALPVAIYVKDLQSRFVMSNDLSLKMLSAETQSEVIGKTDFDFMAHEIAQCYFDAEQKLLRTGAPIVDMEIQFESAQQETQWFLVSKSPIYDNQGNVVGLIGINSNITRQKLAEKSFENQRNLLQTVIDHIQDKIYVKDTAGRFILANALTLKEHEASSGESQLIGKTDFDYVDAGRAQRLFDEEQTIMKTGEALINQELFTPSDVTKRHPMWFLVSKVPIYDANGAPMGVVGINHNITTLKLAEQRRIELELEREKTNLISNFITDASHEFRTPISIIQTSTYLMQKNPDPQEHAKYIKRIGLQTERMSKLIDSLLLMLRLDRQSSIHSRAINYVSLLKNAIQSLESAIQNKSLVLDFHVDHSLADGFGDAKLLTLAFTELLQNAVHYTPERGAIAINSVAENKQIGIRIQDSGIGISAEDLPNIFNRFYRGDEAHSTSGFGLGLAIVQRIIELHQGQIEVKSQINVGSLFTIILPQTNP